MSQLVERFGRTGAAAVTSLIWFVPMAAWAGSSDLSPIDETAYPKVALAIGVVMLIVWFALLTRISKATASTHQHRLDLAQMSTSEKRWTLALVAFGAGLIGWLNAAATVDWSPLPGAVGSGRLGAILFAIALAVFLIAMLAGIWVSWRKSALAYRRRRSSARYAREN
jgi:membrane protease YdiL (CAAX protease family)